MVSVLAQNVTVDQCPAFLYYDNGDDPYDPPYIDAKNCIFSSVVEIAPSGTDLIGSNNGFYNSPQFGSSAHTSATTPFQTSESGAYYLTDGSAFHGAGTTSAIDSTLLTALKTKSTHPPMALPPLMEVTGNLTLFPQVPRYTEDTPDLGYHYDALDYTIATIILEGGSITVEPGTAIGIRNDYISSQDAWTVLGFVVEQGSSLFSSGRPTTPNTFTSLRMVQEEPESDFAQFKRNAGFSYGTVSFVPAYSPDDINSPAPLLNFQFSNFYLSGQDYQLWSGLNEEQNDYWSADSSVYLTLQNCNLYGGQLNFGLPYYYYDPNTGTYPGTDAIYAG
jgi:hypothetical protein